MTELESLARGVLLVGFDGTTLATELAEFFSAEQFAGYVLFARNVDDVAGVRTLTDRLRALHRLAPILAVDQEGGRVMRVRRGVEPIPSMMSLGAADSAALATRAGEQVGFDLRRAGFTLDFAPVVDLARDSRSTVIGTRAFGSHVGQTVTLARAFAAGLERYGITATFKHFPGHGTTALDTHLGLPAVDTDEQTLRENDLSPFAQLAPEAAAMMTAHIIVRSLDRTNPATLSRALLADVLRCELRFSGVCFTDCMQMDAIARTVGTANGAAAAIAAGADCALISHDPQLALLAAQAIERGVRSGAIAYERLREANARVTRLRENSNLPLPLDATAPHRGIGREVARAAVTLLRGSPHADPVASMVLSFQGETHEGAQGGHDVHPSLQSQAPAVAVHVSPLVPDAADRAAAISAIERSGKRPVVLLRRAHVYPEQARAATETIARFPDALVVSMREPYDCALFPQARHLLAVYGDDEASVGGLSDVVFGNAAPHGKLPVNLA